MQVDSVGATLLRAANEVLATEGPAALTVRRIATAAGVSTMNVYSRFGGKDGVVEQLYLEGFRRLSQAMLDVPLTDEPISDLRACGVAYRRFALDNPTYYALMFDGVVEFAPTPGALQRAGETLGLLARRLERAMDAGVLAPGDPLSTAASVWATCHGVVSLERRHLGPAVLDWEHVYHETGAALLRGLAVPAAEQP